MRTIRIRQLSWRPGKVCRATGLVVLWAVLLLGIALPRWREVRRQHAEIGVLENRLADLDRWIVAGLWLEPAVAEREPIVQTEWLRRFPASRDREELFLAVAGVADRCGVREFRLEEVNESGMADFGTWASTSTATDPTAAVGDAPAAGDTDAAMAAAPVAIELDRYVVRTGFVGDYAETAAFLGGLEKIERAIDVRRLAIQPTRGGINVEMELEIYVSETGAS